MKKLPYANGGWCRMPITYSMTEVRQDYKKRKLNYFPSATVGTI